MMLVLVAAAFAADPSSAAPKSAAPMDALSAALALEFAQDGIRGETSALRAMYREACAAGAALACKRETWAGRPIDEAAA
ncbi:MAG: hypothetical protein H0V89_03045, partial [Deltaproteobacteria bacterium]|nr:hypothetical protein [Deltaproteobacteria bacterium]